MKLKQIYISAFLLLVLNSVSWAQLATDTTGGPDGFGYRWITSQSTAHTIDFQWIDVIQALQDFSEALPILIESGSSGMFSFDRKMRLICDTDIPSSRYHTTAY